MALIPTDAGVRIRTQADAPIQPIIPVSEIPGDLLELKTGTLFSARIQEVLPDNTYKALVAGSSVTLALPNAAKAGDTLELVVVDRSLRAVIAQLANPALAEATGQPDQFTTLSPSAQLIGSLLARDGDKSAPALLNRGLPLLPNPPAHAAELAPRLSQAISQSGMFYEAHQVQWATGQRSLAELLAEPQAAHSSPQLLTAYRRESNPSGPAFPQNVAPEISDQKSGPLLPTRVTNTEPELATASQSPATVSSGATAVANKVPDDLRPLVQQQLEAAATQRLAWHGEVWPEQKLEWEIERDSHHQESSGSDYPDWITSLRLTTPRLGEIDARVRLTERGVQISIATPYGAAAGDLREAGPALEKSLEAAGVSLLSLQIKHVDRR